MSDVGIFGFVKYETSSCILVELQGCSSGLPCQKRVAGETKDDIELSGVTSETEGGQLTTRSKRFSSLCVSGL